MMYLSLLKGRVMWGALAVVAMGVVLGGVVASNNWVYAQEPGKHAPAFKPDVEFNLTVPENTPPGTNIGDPIEAEDDDEGILEYGDTLTYSLEGEDAAFFDIDKSTGQIITKAALDYEETGRNQSYSVTVKVEDSASPPNDITQGVTVMVTDVDERPSTPTAPTVVSGEDNDGTDADESTTSLKVVWHAPENTGRLNISTYEVQYKESIETEFISLDDSTITTATIVALKVDTSYQVRVRASSNEGISPWSLVGTGSTNKEGNSAPFFSEGNNPLRSVRENAPAGQDIEGPVRADDDDSTGLTHRLDGPDADSFDFDAASGQIRTKRGVTYDSETKSTYLVTVAVTDRAGGSDAVPMQINIIDTTERPQAPARPTVRATEKSSRSLDISWNAPENTGPAITSYEVRYRTGSEDFSSNGVVVTGTTATISGTDSGNDETPWLSPNTSYEVQVRAADTDEGTSAWSASGTGKTGRANHQPIFADRPHDGDTSERNISFTTSRSIDENIRANQPVGTIKADDGDNDRLTYKLSGTNAVLFDINETTGQIRTKAGVTYDYERMTGGGQLRCA